MCAVTAAAVGTAVSVAATVGSQVAGAVSSKGGGGGSSTPQTKPIPGFAPATGLQGYTARLLAANRNTRTPGIMEWAASGGDLRPDWKIPEFTAKEAEQLRFVDKRGKALPGFDPNTDTNLSPEAKAQRARERATNLSTQGYAVPMEDKPALRYAHLQAREEMLQSRIADKATPKLQNRLAKVQGKASRARAKLV